jgi:hypothetical protein
MLEYQKEAILISFLNEKARYKKSSRQNPTKLFRRYLQKIDYCNIHQNFEILQLL